MVRLTELIGVETDLMMLAAAVRDFVEDLETPVVGCHHVTCSDETERECEAAWQEHFVDALLPSLKPGQPSSFRTTNLGARYEWGAVRVGEEHFALAADDDTPKFMVVKLNAHVAVRSTPDGLQYGMLERYGQNSTCCGALAGMLAGSLLPGIQQLRETLNHDGRNRVGVLANPRHTPPEHRALLAAVINARLQSRRAVLDIQECHPVSPTIFLVLPCVTINRPNDQRDTELLVGQHGVDYTQRKPIVRYRGLGDDPMGIMLRHKGDRLVLEDDHWPDGGEAT